MCLDPWKTQRLRKSYVIGWKQFKVDYTGKLCPLVGSSVFGAGDPPVLSYLGSHDGYHAYRCKKDLWYRGKSYTPHVTAVVVLSGDIDFDGKQYRATELHIAAITEAIGTNRFKRMSDCAYGIWSFEDPTKVLKRVRRRYPNIPIAL